jgi:hypothetical protein
MNRRPADPPAPAARTPAASPGLVQAHRVVAAVLAALVLLQAVVAGRALFGPWDIEVHGWMGNGSFTLGIVLVVLAVASRAGRTAVVTAAALAVLMFAQTGLGYAGRTSADAASWHVPLGVAIFGLAVFHAAVAVPGRRAPAGAR